MHDVSMQTQLLIAGEWRDGADRFDVENPATEDVIASVAAGSTTHATEACEAAANFQAAWRETPAKTRADVLPYFFLIQAAAGSPRYRRR